MHSMKTTATVEPAAPSLESAEARWAKIQAKHCKMIEARDGMEMARSFSLDRNNKRVPPHLRKKAAPFLKMAVRRPEKLNDQLADIEDEIDESTSEYEAVRDLWNAARRRETTRIAGDLQPRHRVAVIKIAEALSAMSRAMEAEAEIRAELARTAPEVESALLPNCIAGLVIGSLGDFNSPASDWARRMRKIGILG